MVEPLERRFLIVAGEASGDAHAARLVRGLRSLGPCRVRGVAGPAMIAEGVEGVLPTETLAVVGFTGVVARLPRLWSAFRRLLAEARRFRPRAAVLVDAPGFNFRIGPALKRLGIPIFYYIAPQVWAWHPERAAQMRRWVDRLAVVFPFEESLFRDAGVEAHFVGHPLLEALEPEVDAATFRAELGLPAAGGRILGLMAGSRRQELRAHAPVMLEAARLLSRGRPDLVVALAMAPGLGRDDLPALGGDNRQVRVLFERTHALQAYADGCVVASGTATLETALFGTPEVIVYRTGWLNYAIARRLVRLRHIGLPNIVCGEAVAPERIQGDCTPAGIAGVVAPWLDDPAARRAQHDRLREVRERLGTPGASARAAALLWEMTG